MNKRTVHIAIDIDTDDAFSADEWKTMFSKGLLLQWFGAGMISRGSVNVSIDPDDSDTTPKATPAMQP